MQRVDKVAMHQGILGRKLDGLPITVQSGLDVASIEKGMAKITLVVRIDGLKSDPLSAAGDGFVHLAYGSQSSA